jgi:uncharacterized protein YggE
MRRPRSVLLVSLTLAGAILVARSAEAQATAVAVSEPEPNIQTVGTGERRIPPDRASVHLLVESKAPEASTAATSNARVVQSVRDSLRRLGLDSAVTTASYNVGPNYEPPRPMEREGPRQVGYVARTLLRVHLTRIDQVGRVIDAGLAGGATGVQGVLFEASSAQSAHRDAIARAAAAARQDAEELARSLGGSLGPLISSTTGNVAGGPAMRYPVNAVNFEYSTQIAPNEIVVNAMVTTKWKFIPNR